MADPADAPKADAAPDSATDEDILRLRSRLEREFALVAQKLVDAEEALVDIEISLRTYETGSRPRLVAASPDKSGEGITSRFKAVGEGLSKIKDWVVKKDAAEGAPKAAGPDGRVRDLEDRLEDALRSVSAEIRDREKEATDIDRRLHEAQKDLIRVRAQEQQAREMQIKIGQTRQLSEDLERRMAMLDEMVRTLEPSKTEGGARPKPAAATPALPKLDDRLQGAIDEALKAVAAQEKKLGDLEKEAQRANAALVDERARQQRIRAMQLRLRQARHFSSDLQRSLAGLSASVEDLTRRAAGLLRPEVRKDASRVMPKPAAEAPVKPS